jgi:anthranilate synthase component 1
MPATPDYDTFAARYAAGVPQVVSTRLVADLETPVSALFKLAGDKPHSFLLNPSRAAPRAGAIPSSASRPT